MPTFSISSGTRCRPSASSARHTRDGAGSSAETSAPKPTSPLVQDHGAVDGGKVRDEPAQLEDGALQLLERWAGVEREVRPLDRRLRGGRGDLLEDLEEEGPIATWLVLLEPLFEAKPVEGRALLRLRDEDHTALAGAYEPQCG